MGERSFQMCHAASLFDLRASLLAGDFLHHYFFKYCQQPRFDISNSDSPAAGFVNLTKQFMYLGSVIGCSLISGVGADMRIKVAT
jgi:hypothetical protein